MKLGHFCWVHLQFFCILCGAPTLACDHCLCETIEAIAEANEGIHDECECCGCSPFTTCSNCSGFTISELIDYCPLSLEQTDSGTPLVEADLQLEERAVICSAPDAVRLPKWRDFVARSHKMRGSPLFS